MRALGGIREADRQTTLTARLPLSHETSMDSHVRQHCQRHTLGIARNCTDCSHCFALIVTSSQHLHGPRTALYFAEYLFYEVTCGDQQDSSTAVGTPSTVGELLSRQRVREPADHGAKTGL